MARHADEFIIQPDGHTLNLFTTSSRHRERLCQKAGFHCFYAISQTLRGSREMGMHRELEQHAEEVVTAKTGLWVSTVTWNVNLTTF